MRGSRKPPPRTQPATRLPTIAPSGSPVPRGGGGSFGTNAAIPPAQIFTDAAGRPSSIGDAAADEGHKAEGDPLASSSVPLARSRLPAAFHMRDASGRLLFPSERPKGDADIGLLAETLGAMLEEWRGRLEENKPTFPLGAARWGVLQMCIYDMCATHGT
jgi:hypothetical protein